MLCLLAAMLALLSPAASAASILTEVRAEKGGFRLMLDWPAPFKAFRLSDPERFVVDLKDTLPATAGKTAAGAGPVQRVRVAPSGLEPSTTRVVFELSRRAGMSAAAAPDGIAVAFEPPAPEGPAELKDALAPLPRLAPPPPFLHDAGPVPAPEARLLAVEVSGDRAVLSLSRDAAADIFFAAAPPRLVIDLPGVRHDAAAIAAPPAGGILLGARSAPFSRDVTRVVLDLARPAPYSVERGDRRIAVVFSGDAAPAALPASRTREFRGWVVGADGRPLDGVFLVRFSIAEEGSLEGIRWSESLYVDARGGRFASVLGRFSALPADALSAGFPVDAQPPAGVSYRIVPR